MFGSLKHLGDYLRYYSYVRSIYDGRDGKLSETAHGTWTCTVVEVTSRSTSCEFRSVMVASFCDQSSAVLATTLCLDVRSCSSIFHNDAIDGSREAGCTYCFGMVYAVRTHVCKAMLADSMSIDGIMVERCRERWLGNFNNAASSPRGDSVAWAPAVHSTGIALRKRPDWNSAIGHRRCLA